ncbi:MAG: hypothetical protein PHC60_01935 [Heliobacteriaceae bacterium]|nr:hypothetical protein [Heliobacteriaceae bacterium]MDD4587138.1 hypothetical protein [Heliobacteriaceae bacterium]
MGCPLCGGNQVGRVGVSQYYCWRCYVEFNERNEVFTVGEDGSLVALTAEPSPVGNEVAPQPTG